MEGFLEFVSNNYGWFLTASIILVFAIIGYVVDLKRSKNDVFTQKENEMDEINLENIQVQEGKSLNDMVSTSKNINKETMQVELTDSEVLMPNETNINHDQNAEAVVENLD